MKHSPNDGASLAIGDIQDVKSKRTLRYLSWSHTQYNRSRSSGEKTKITVKYYFYSYDPPSKPFGESVYVIFHVRFKTYNALVLWCWVVHSDSFSLFSHPTLISNYIYWRKVLQGPCIQRHLLWTGPWKRVIFQRAEISASELSFHLYERTSEMIY